MNAILSSGRRLAPLLRRFVPTNATGILAICLLFGALIAASVYAAKKYTDFGTAGTAGAVLELASDNPAAQFSKTGVGQVLFANSRGDSCRRFLFDNRTGRSHETNEVACGQPVESAEAAESDRPGRVKAMSKSFQK